MPVHIRILTPDDTFSYRELRLRALLEHPEAFATSYQEEFSRPIANTAKRLSPGPDHITLGAFDETLLLGIATLIRPTKTKLRHKATLAAMYVVPEAREKKLGHALLDKIIAVAGEWGVSDVTLAITVGNQSARKLYTNAGFV